MSNNSFRKQLVVFSGGSAANSIVDVFSGLVSNGAGSLEKLSYIIGISDNGGSTSEILRVFGGPGIGDIRSRLIRLIPASNSDAEKLAIKQLLNYRLPASNLEAKIEWLEIVEGTHAYWKQIPSDKRELIRSFLIFLNAEIVKRARPPISTFNFHSASIGNLFLTGARIFFGSFESAIYLFHSITGIPENTQVIPAINSNFAHHIAAGLVDETVIVGQNQISHPSDTSAVSLMPSSENIYSTVPSGAVTPVPSGAATPIPSSPHELFPTPAKTADEDSDDENDGVEDANLPGSHPSLRTQNIVFEKENEPELPARIDRIWYINPYGQEIRPPANPKVVAAINEAEALVYSIGSLYTSIIPCLVLRGIGHAIASPHIRYKILILNGSLDRETGPVIGNPPMDFSASDFVRAIVRACVDSQSRKLKPLALNGGSKNTDGNSANGVPEPVFIPPSEYTKYITHVVYLEGPSTPYVNATEFRSWGIIPVKVYGMRTENGNGKAYYDVATLQSALETILGHRGRRPKAEGTRRDTVVPVPAGGR
ncbi:hypothetical protein BDZ91DRAFT_695347 [Kalaharituber pfeilii]|nr:hypothetical protein BDZ91DRAFT_695347 [Kalaharituber pfeilii]